MRSLINYLLIILFLFFWKYLNHMDIFKSWMRLKLNPNYRQWKSCSYPLFYNHRRPPTVSLMIITIFCVNKMCVDYIKDHSTERNVMFKLHRFQQKPDFENEVMCQSLLTYYVCALHKDTWIYVSWWIKANFSRSYIVFCICLF